MNTQLVRRGLSLVELIVVIALLGLAATAISSAILNQQRFHGDAAALLDVRQGVRDAMEVLSTDIRGSSPADTIRLMADSALEIFAAIGTSVACRTVSATAIALAAESPHGALTSFLAVPDSGDLAFVFKASPDSAAGEWQRHRIAGVSATVSTRGCLIDGGQPFEGFVLTLQGSLPAPIPPGAAVRFVRRGRYSLYRSSDGLWYLGYRRCNATGPSACGAIQPVSGPYKRYSSDPGTTGFLFEYFDGEGQRATSSFPLSVARIDITARAEKERRGAGGGTQRRLRGSATASVAIRNR